MFVKNSISTVQQLPINGGEDYELLFTIAMEDFEKSKQSNFIVYMTQESESIHLVTRANTKIALKLTWWDTLTE
jgi:thiamine-monophosphate kinase